MFLKNLVDVIVPVYNSEKFILKTINSIINQNYTNWRVIIIDDGSTDKTVDLLNNFYKKFTAW